MYTIEKVQDLIWKDQNKTYFSCNVKFLEFDNVIPICVRSDDKYTHIQTLWNNAIAGVYGDIGPYIEIESQSEFQGKPATGVEEM